MLRMIVGEKVTTVHSLPHKPTGSIGIVKEVGALFLMVEFEDGRQGYYRPHQVQRVQQGG